MKTTRRHAVLACVLVLTACGEGTMPTGNGPGRRGSGENSGPRVVGHSSSFHAAPIGGAVSYASSLSNTMYYHGGRILPVANLQVIYWATSPIYQNGPTPGTIGYGTRPRPASRGNSIG